MFKLFQSIDSIQCLKTSVISVSQFNQSLTQNMDFINFMYLKDYFVQILQLGQNGQQMLRRRLPAAVIPTNIYCYTTTLIKIAIFEDVTPCSLVQAYQLNRHICCPHYHGRCTSHSSTVIMEAGGTNEITEENNLHFQSVQWERQISQNFYDCIKQHHQPTVRTWRYQSATV